MTDPDAAARQAWSDDVDATVARLMDMWEGRIPFPPTPVPTYAQTKDEERAEAIGEQRAEDDWVSERDQYRAGERHYADGGWPV